MIVKQLSAIVILLLFLTVNIPFAIAQTDSDTAKIKAKIVKRGTGEKKRIKVRLIDGSSQKGYISQIESDSFNLTDTKTGQVSTIAYRDVKEVNKSGGLSTGAIIAIAATGAAAIILGSLLRRRICNESAC